MTATTNPTDRSFLIAGRAYTLRLTHAAIDQIKLKTGVDLYSGADMEDDAATGGLVDAVLIRTDKLIPAVYDLIKDQHVGLSYNDFIDQIDGDALDAIGTAMWGAVADFFRRRPIGRATAAAGGAVKMVDLIWAAMSAPGGGNSSAGSPQSPESTPTPEPPAN